MLRALLFIALLLPLAACDEPFIVFAGGKLSGEELPPPADWSELGKAETIQLETNPEDPYSVNIWVAGIGPDLYIGTGPEGTRWTKNIADDPRVRVRIEGNIYPLIAHPVTDPAERRRVARAYVDKYELDPDGDWLIDALVFRLDRR
ncbi:MAG: nitroreductase/quinone reductase family protein [Pseudomonadales bacterium]